MTIIIAHPSWPWQDERFSVGLHKPNVYIDLSGWIPNISRRSSSSTPTPAENQDAVRLRLATIAPDRWLKDFREAVFKPEVHDLILKENAIRALKIAVEA